MPDLSFQFPEVLKGVAGALLIGLLIGAEREMSRDEEQAGIRDFALIALTGAVCAVVQAPWLTVMALAAIGVVLGVARMRAERRTGVTTEMAAVATFCLSYLAAAPGVPHGSKLATGLAILASTFLAAKRSMHKLVRESITHEEFNGTLRFLALIFVIYPLLPEGHFGPYGFFEPRKVWLFVILVSSISYLGYFFEKFLGPEKGIRITSVLAGISSTTAATLAFARSSALQRDNLMTHWWATVIANATQFPRVAVLLYLFSPSLAISLLLPLLAMTVVGLLLGLLISRFQQGSPEQGGMGLRNPFSLGPALQFGLVFTVILFVVRAAAAESGAGGIYWTSVLGGSLDVDAASISVADLFGQNGLDLPAARLAILLALAANAVAKTAIAAYAGTFAFALRVAGSFLAIFVVGFGVWYLR